MDCPASPAETASQTGRLGDMMFFFLLSRENLGGFSLFFSNTGSLVISSRHIDIIQL
jgi:hypothetical protein